MGTRFSILEGKFELATKGIKFHNNEYLVLIPNFIIFDELSQMVGVANNCRRRGVCKQQRIPTPSDKGGLEGKYGLWMVGIVFHTDKQYPY